MNMNRQVDRQRLRWKRKPFPELARLAWPITVSMLSYSVMTLVDTLFVGRLGAHALAAVGLGGTVAFTIVCFGIGALRAEKILVSMTVGAGRVDRVPAIVGAGLVLATFMGCVVALVGQGVAPVLHRLSGDASGQLASIYVAIRSAAAPLVLAALSLRQTRQGLGDAQGPMRAALVANVANIALDAWLIFGCGLGVAGAALGSCIAQAIELAFLFYIQRPDGLGLGALSRADLLELWRLGAPQGLERLLDASAFTLVVALFARMGAVDLAAHQVNIQLMHFCFLPAFAVSEAASVLSGQAVGAGEFGLVRRVARHAMLLTFGYLVLCAVGFVTAGDLLVRCFTSDDRVVARASELLLAGACLVLVLPLYTVSQGVLRGVGDVRFSFVVTVVAAWALTPVFAATLGLGLGLGALGGWIGLAAEIAVGGLVLRSRLVGGGWMGAARRIAERAAARDVSEVPARPRLSGRWLARRSV